MWWRFDVDVSKSKSSEPFDFIAFVRICDDPIWMELCIFFIFIRVDGGWLLRLRFWEIIRCRNSSWHTNDRELTVRSGNVPFAQNPLSLGRIDGTPFGIIHAFYEPVRVAGASGKRFCLAGPYFREMLL